LLQSCGTHVVSAASWKFSTMPAKDVTFKSTWRTALGTPTAGRMGAVAVVEIATVLAASRNVTKPMAAPFASVPMGRPAWKSWITCSIGPTSSTAIVCGAPPVPGNTMAQPHISFRVSPSSGAPAGWKSVALSKAENGMRT
jgi:hypothetical protein